MTVTTKETKKRRGRKKAAEMTPEDIEAAITNPQSKNYVCKQTLHNDVVSWQARVKAHNTKYNDIIMEYMSEEEKNDKRRFLHYYEKATMAAARDKRIPPEPVMPDSIGIAILKICEGISMRHNYRGYTYRDEMVRDAIVDCVRGVKKYDGTKNSNPFGYFSVAAERAFWSRMEKEKRAHQTKMDLSFDPDTRTFDTQDGDYGQDFDINTSEVHSFYYANK